MTVPHFKPPIAGPGTGALFAVIALLKLGLLVALGPIHTPADSEYYIGFANLILGSPDWLDDAGLAAAAIPVTAFHAFGYPAILAGAMRIGGTFWPYLVIALQFAFSLVAGFAIYRAALRLRLPHWAGLAAVAAYLLSFPLQLDQALLSDSLHGSLVAIAVCLLVVGIRPGRPLRLATAVLAGLLLALAFLIREALEFLVLAFVPLLAVAAVVAGRAVWLRSALALSLVLAPLIATVAAYEAWNVHRTGVPFVTTTAQFNLPYALDTAAHADPAVIAGDTPFDRAARATLLHRDMIDDVLRFNDTMFHAGFLAPDIARLAYAHYFAGWRHQPLAMLSILQLHLSERAAKLTFRPFASICETLQATTRAQYRDCDYRELTQNLKQDLTHGLRAPFSGVAPAELLLFVLRTLAQALAIVLFAGFLLGVPAMVLAGGPRLWRALDVPAAIVAAFWCLYVLWFLAYGIVHLEDRYMMPVLPAATLGGLFVWQRVHAKLYGRLRELFNARGPLIGQH